MHSGYGTETEMFYRPTISVKAEGWVAAKLCHLPIVGRKEDSRSR